MKQVLIVLLGLLAAASVSEARPGGGSSYRSSSSSSSSSSRSSSSSSRSSSSGARSYGSGSSGSAGYGSGGADLAPNEAAVLAAGLIGLFFLFVVVAVVRAKLRLAETERPSEAEPQGSLSALKARDPGFSRVALLDYVNALYHALYGWLGTPQGKALRVRVATALLERLERAEAGARHTEIVLGAATIVEIEVGYTQDVTLELEGNFTRERAGAAPERMVQRERWRLSRTGDAHSPEPAKPRVLACRSCGAPLSVSELGACTYCGADLVQSADWRLVERDVLSTEAFSTSGLGETVAEAGTSLATVVDPDLGTELDLLAAGDADFTEAFERVVVTQTFQQMYAAWQDKAWDRVRPLLTDFLWESQKRWVDAYKAKRLTNRLDDLALTRIDLARVERDPYFDAVTVRVFAECRDFTIDDQGNVVGGRPSELRKFTEYWTFIRAAGRKASPKGSTEAQNGKCPNCGAPLDRIGQAGLCGYCSAKVTTGDFGWVLATITQDEDYGHGL